MTLQDANYIYIAIYLDVCFYLNAWIQFTSKSEYTICIYSLDISRHHHHHHYCSLLSLPLCSLWLRRIKLKVYTHNKSEFIRGRKTYYYIHIHTYNFIKFSKLYKWKEPQQNFPHLANKYLGSLYIHIPRLVVLSYLRIYKCVCASFLVPELIDRCTETTFFFVITFFQAALKTRMIVFFLIIHKSGSAWYKY